MRDQHLNISITATSALKAILVIAAAAALYYLRDIVLIVMTAIVIASAIEPAVAGLMRYHFPRVVAVITIYLLFFTLFFVIFYFFLPSLLEDVATFLSSLPAYLDTFTRAGAFDQYSKILGIAQPTALTANDIMTGIRGSLSMGSSYSNALGAASQVFGGVSSFILIIVFSFYLAVLETGVDDFLRVVAPRAQREYVLGLWRRSQHKIGLWMQGQLILAVIMGVIIFLLLTIFRIPHALVLAVIAAVFEIIPVFGPTLAAVPAIAIAFASGGLSLSAVALGIYVIAQMFENHLIYPQVVTRVVGVPPLLVILALIIGGQLAGFLGIILAVPLSAVVQELVRDIEAGVLFASHTERES